MIKLYDHQKHILELLTANDSYAVLAEQGTGKTLPMLFHLSNLVRFGGVQPDRILVVAPLSALGAWQRDTEKLPKYMQQFVSKVDYINYDKLSREGGKWREIITSKQYQVIVLDEAHAIAKRTSNRSKFFIGYKKRGRGGVVKGQNEVAKYRYILTGTLVTNGRLEDVWSPMEFVNPKGLGEWVDFCARYLRTKRIGVYDIVIGYRNQDELQDYLSRHSVRVLKKDCLDLPEKMPDEVIKVPLIETAIYKQLEEGFIDHKGIEVVCDNPLVSLAKKRQVASGFIIDQNGECHTLNSEKPNYCMELIESILPSKVVIFCEFKHSIRTLSKLLKAKKLSFVVLDGDQKDKSVWRKFQDDDTIKIIICQWSSGNSGIDLFASSHFIAYDMTLSTTVLEQARDRLHRSGQRNPCNYYFLLTEGTVDEVIYKRLANKQDFTLKFYEETYYKGDDI